MKLDCRIFHICLDDGTMNSFPCPNGTVFSQVNSVCVWGDDVNCQQSHLFYPKPTMTSTIATNTQIPSPTQQNSFNSNDKTSNQRGTAKLFVPPQMRPPLRSLRTEFNTLQWKSESFILWNLFIIVINIRFCWNELIMLKNIPVAPCHISVVLWILFELYNS